MTSIMPTVAWDEFLASSPNYSELSPGSIMNTLPMPSPSSISSNSMDSHESSAMTSPMQLSPQVIFLDTITMSQEEMMGVPYLIMKEEPVEKFRFRYKSEMMGTHGSILGRNSDKNRKKSYPTVELCNYHGPAIIRCSLYTAHPSEAMRTPHTHRLVVRMDNDDKDDPHEIRVSREAGYVATFQGMGIIHTAKKHIADELVKKKRARFLEVQRLKNINACSLSTKDEAQIRHEAEQEAKRMNLNSVTLCFEAFRQDGNGLLYPLCQRIFSKPINNMKSALTGELKICRIDKHVSSCLGGEEVFILVEKVGKKNIKIRFFEVDDEDNVVWEDFGKFSELDVHHQYAIVFRTPPYRHLDIEDSVPVFLQLYRPTDGDSSEPIKFTYRPSDKIGRSRKRQRSTLEPNIPVVIETDPNHFVKSKTVSNPFNGSNMVSDPMLGSQPDLNVESDPNDIFQYLKQGDELMNSQEFQDYMENISLSDLNWLPPPRSRLATTENDKQDLSKLPSVLGSLNADNKPNLQQLRTDCTENKLNLPQFRNDLVKNPLFNGGSANFGGKLPPTFNFGTEMFGNKLPSFLTFGTENLLSKMPPPFSMGMENKPPVNYMDTSYGVTLHDMTIKLEQRFNPEYGTTLPVMEECDLATDGPNEKPALKPVVDVRPARERRIKMDIPATPEDETTLQLIKLEINAPLEFYSSEELAVKVMERLQELSKRNLTPHEMKEQVSRVLTTCKSKNGDLPLHAAILNEQKDLLKQMLEVLSRVKDTQIINHRNRHTNTPLHVAVQYDQVDTVKVLLAAGADPNAVNNMGDSPLHIATEASLDECMDELLNMKNYRTSNFRPQFDLRNYKGWTPLHLAALTSNLEAIKKLVSAGADVNMTDSTYGRTVLHIAVEENCKDVVEYLLKETRIDVNFPNYSGNTALHNACVVGGKHATAIAKLLVEFKADPYKANYIARRKSVEELGATPLEGIALKQEPESDEESEDEDRLKINEFDDDEVQAEKLLRGHTSFDLAYDNQEILELLKKVEEQQPEGRRSKTPELEVEVKEECGSPVSENTVVEENGLFDRETMAKLCERLDANKSWVNLAEFLDYNFLIPSIRKTKSPTRLLLNYADLHGNVAVRDIRHYLEILDEEVAVGLIDQMLARQGAGTTT